MRSRAAARGFLPAPPRAPRPRPRMSRGGGARSVRAYRGGGRMLRRRDPRAFLLRYCEDPPRPGWVLGPTLSRGRGALLRRRCVRGRAEPERDRDAREILV